jgi:hypothetical protein
LQPHCDIDGVSVQVSPIRDRVADVDPNAKTDCTVSRLVAVKDRDLLLNLHSTAHGPIDALKGDEQRIASGLYDLVPMLLDCWVDQVRAQSPQPLQGS